jgi:HSP20 family protein
MRQRRDWNELPTPLETMFGNMLPNWWGHAPTTERRVGVYPIDVREEDGKLIVDAEMPGFKRDEIDVGIDDRVLTIRAERTPEETRGTPHLNERHYTRYERSFTLPNPVDTSRVEANLEDGVLHLEMPETEETGRTRIEIK